MNQRDDPSSDSLQNSLITTVMLPVSVIVVACATAFVGKAVCRTGNGFCADNIVPGPIIAGFLFALVHLASKLFSTFTEARYLSIVFYWPTCVAAVIGYVPRYRSMIATAAAAGAGFFVGAVWLVACFVAWERLPFMSKPT